MAWKILLQSVLIGFFTKDISGNDDMNRCPEHLARTNYLKTFGEMCYWYENSELDWPTARSRCTEEGGDLIQIRNQATQNWVMTTLSDLHWNTNGVWIGAHDRHNETDWCWVTGDKVVWDNWASGHPNSNLGCGNLRRDDGGKWHDKLCYPYIYSYICQYETKQATTTKTPTTTTITTTTPTTTKTIPSTITATITETTVKTTTQTRGDDTVNQTGKFAEQKSTMNEGELSGVIVASVLGAIALLTLLSFCFFRTRNSEFLTGSQSIDSDPNEGTACQTKLSNVSVTVKESGHYSEISKHKMGDKLIVSLPNYDNNEYEECNIATRKVGVSDSPQYLNESADSKTVYYSVSENEAGCNAMNEQLETSKNQYDECGNGEGSVNSPIYYIDMTGAEEIGESTVDLYA